MDIAHAGINRHSNVSEKMYSKTLKFNTQTCKRFITETKKVPFYSIHVNFISKTILMRKKQIAIKNYGMDMRFKSYLSYYITNIMAINIFLTVKKIPAYKEILQIIKMKTHQASTLLKLTNNVIFKSNVSYHYTANFHWHN